MLGETLTTLQNWAVALLLYPGLLFAFVLFLAGERFAGLLRGIFTPRVYRLPAARHAALQPVYDLVKLAGRQGSQFGGAEPGGAARGVLVSAGMAAPVLALSLLPLPGNPLYAGGAAFGVIVVPVLLAVQPLTSSALRLLEGGAASLEGAGRVHRLVVGLPAILLAIAALAEVSGGHSLLLSSLLAAPEIAPQTLVRLLAGAVLLFALPWWASNVERSAAGLYVGPLLQRAALAAFWAALVLPMPGELPWALVLLLGGSLLAYVVMLWLTYGTRLGRRTESL